MDETPGQLPRAAEPAGRQPYHRPALCVYGDVRRLTLHGGTKNRRDSIFINTRT